MLPFCLFSSGKDTDTELFIDGTGGSKFTPKTSEGKAKNDSKTKLSAKPTGEENVIGAMKCRTSLNSDLKTRIVTLKLKPLRWTKKEQFKISISRYK